MLNLDFRFHRVFFFRKKDIERSELLLKGYKSSAGQKYNILLILCFYPSEPIYPFANNYLSSSEVSVYSSVLFLQLKHGFTKNSAWMRSGELCKVCDHGHEKKAKLLCSICWQPVEVTCHVSSNIHGKKNNHSATFKEMAWVVWVFVYMQHCHKYKTEQFSFFSFFSYSLFSFFLFFSRISFFSIFHCFFW